MKILKTFTQDLKMQTYIKPHCSFKGSYDLQGLDFYSLNNNTTLQTKFLHSPSLDKVCSGHARSRQPQEMQTITKDISKPEDIRL